MKRSPIPSKRLKPRRKGNPSPRIKPDRQEDPAHLAALRRFGCWGCRVDGLGWAPAEPHHTRPGQGMGTKADDSQAIPLCRKHHNEQHPDSVSIHRNPIQFRQRYGTESEIRDRVAEAMKAQEAA
jgi:hypothetical protein